MTNDDLRGKFNKSLEKFGQGINNVFTEVTTLEVNTIIVSQITGMKFDPEETYHLIYHIPQDENDYLTNDDLECFSSVDDELLNRFRDLDHEDLRKRHMNIRRKLEKALKYSNLKNADGTMISHLPSPDNQLEIVKRLLDNDRFLRELRKLSELKSVLESKEAPEDNVCDIIYAQTIIQLDGDIMNRFDRKLFEDEELNQEDKSFLIKTHNEAVIAGEKNWRELIKLLVELVKDIAAALPK